MPQELLGELVREVHQRRPSRLALIWREQEYSYLTLDAEIDRVAANLLEQGVEKGERIALYMHNIPQFVIAFYALQRLGAVVVPLNIYWKERDLRYLLHESRVSGLITIGPLYDRVADIRDNLPELRWVVVIGAASPPPAGVIFWEELASGRIPDPVQAEVDAIEPAVIAYTTGRTGPSRPAMLSHFNLLANCQQMQDLARVRFLGDANDEEERLTPSPIPGANSQEVALLPLPLFNLFGLNIGLNLTYMLAGTAVLMERFDPAQALELVERQQCTVIYGSPAIFSELVNAPGFAEAKLDSLRYVFSYGLPLPISVQQAWQTKTGQPIYNCYGITEASPLLCCAAAGEELTEESVGPALPMVQVALLGPTGDELKPGEVGEMVAKGPNLMLGYFDPANPAEPLPARLEDGWLPTGDLAMLDEAGNFQIIDRKEDTLLLPPDNDLFVPRDIERVLSGHPGVWEVAALPHTGQDKLNHMVAFVVLNEQGRGLTEPQLMYYCQNRLPAKLCPERIFIYRDNDLLRLPNGAVWRRALRQQIPDYL